MKRPHLNFLIDAVAFAAFLFLASTGVLLRYQLPPGSGGLAGRGTGRGEGLRSVETLWGWTRHEWGSIHYWIACLLMAVLAVHLILHWNWITCVLRGRASDRSGGRVALGVAGLCMLVLLAVAPWLAPTRHSTRQALRSTDAPPASEPTGGVDELEAFENEEPLSAGIRGSMSFGQIADETRLSVDYLLERLGLPADVSPDERAGRLLRAHGLQMRDLRRVVDQAAQGGDAHEQ